MSHSALSGVQPENTETEMKAAAEGAVTFWVLLIKVKQIRSSSSSSSGLEPEGKVIGKIKLKRAHDLWPAVKESYGTRIS